MDAKQISSYFSNLLKSNQDSLLKDLNRIKIEKDKFSDSPQWIKTVLALSLQRADANRIYSNIEVDYLKICDASQF